MPEYNQIMLSFIVKVMISINYSKNQIQTNFSISEVPLDLPNSNFLIY